MRRMMLEPNTSGVQSDWLHKLVDTPYGGARYASGSSVVIRNAPCSFTRPEDHVPDAHLFKSNAATGTAKPPLLNSDQLRAIIMEHSAQAQRIRAEGLEDVIARQRIEIVRLQEVLDKQSSLLTEMVLTAARDATSRATDSAMVQSEGDAVFFGKPKRRSPVRMEFRGLRRGRPLVMPEDFAE